MSGPFDPLSLTASVAANLATSILQEHLERIEGSVVGKALEKVGLLKPGFDQRLHATLTSAINKFVNSSVSHKNEYFISFIKDPSVSAAVRDYIITGTPYDASELREMFADRLDIPKKTPDVAWPHGLRPKKLIAAFFEQIDHEFALSADPAIIWISRQNARIVEKLDKSSEAFTKLSEHLASEEEREFLHFKDSYYRHMRKRCNTLSTPGVRQLRDVDQSLRVPNRTIFGRNASRRGWRLFGGMR
ncbi:hypothetical protein M5E06_18010 [Azospirillum sp. A1-3]|uniref:hypothetical protein n=1 Tax=Azospirillum sp. A1-3 TaxID=185874 RepID=UPI0020771C36|nr:hypothetical protein [Azospirillum sp. A1-3]MCM8736032.1 hypothetical protein [Azospirillum sp. A1-3]